MICRFFYFSLSQLNYDVRNLRIAPAPLLRCNDVTTTCNFCWNKPRNKSFIWNVCVCQRKFLYERLSIVIQQAKQSPKQCRHAFIHCETVCISVDVMPCLLKKTRSIYIFIIFKMLRLLSSFSPNVIVCDHNHADWSIQHILCHYQPMLSMVSSGPGQAVYVT